MESKNETFSEALELTKAIFFKDIGSINERCQWCRDKLSSQLDRIEAAHKREFEQLKMLNDSAHTITCDAVTYNENEGVSAIVKEWRDRPISIHTEPEESARLDKLHSAYYAELREVAELRECLKEALEEKCSGIRPCDGCWGHQICKFKRWRKALKGANHDNS